MPIQVRLYGNLKEKVQLKNDDVGAPSILNIENENITTVSDILKELNNG